LSREFGEGPSIELLYADDPVLMVETEDLLVKIQKWKNSMDDYEL